MKDYRKKIETSAIFLTSVLLVLSLIGLWGKTMAVNNTDRYPKLNVTAPTERLEPTSKTIYLTFDDGPSQNTEAVLDVLKEKGVKAAFFVTAQNADEDYTPIMLQRMIDEGHAIGLHSYKHAGNKIYKSVDTFLDDINKLNDYLEETVGIQPKFLRFAGGSATINAKPEVMRAIIEEIHSRGYSYYDWDVVSGDDVKTAKPVETLVNKVVGESKQLDRAVLLFHDNPVATTTPAAVAQIIDQLTAEGYTFALLNEEVEPVHIISTRLGNKN